MKNTEVKLQRMKEALEAEIVSLEQQIGSTCGHLRVTSSKKGTPQYYHIVDKGDTSGKYLSMKKDMAMIRSLAQKDYNKAILPKLKEQVAILDNGIFSCQSMKPTNIYSNLHPFRKKLLLPNAYDDVSYALVWEKVAYQAKPFKEDSTEIYSERGERVRSKSEKMIADKLLMMGIPYRYEYPLKLNGFGTVYPDFTILDVSTNEIIYWEHFGRMDDLDYANKTIRKINQYARNGYSIGDKLLVTFETRQTLIYMRDVEKMLIQRLGFFNRYLIK